MAAVVVDLPRRPGPAPRARLLHARSVEPGRGPSRAARARTAHRRGAGRAHVEHSLRPGAHQCLTELAPPRRRAQHGRDRVRPHTRPGGEIVNQLHLEFLASPGWAQYLEEQLGPWLARVPELSGDVLEVGPGPGLTTDLLRRRAATVTAVEVDEQLGVALSRRLAGTNVDVVVADATDTGLPDGRFSAATSFTMLHHMPA